MNHGSNTKNHEGDGETLPNDAIVNWAREAAKQHLKDVIDEEVENVEDITPQTWKIVAHNVMKHVKDAPQMSSLLMTMKNNIYTFTENLLRPFDERPEYMPARDLQIKAPFSISNWKQKHTNAELLHPKHHHKVVDNICHQRPLKVRLQAFNTLLKSQLSDAITSNSWIQMQHNLQESLCDTDLEIFSLTLKVYSKLLSLTSSVNSLKEGYLGLVEGLRSHYSRKYHKLLPDFERGIKLNNLVHQRIVRISHLILEATKEMPKNWVRMGERHVDEIMCVFLALMTMHTYNSVYSKNILYPFHIVATLDPNAKWCLHWLHGGFGRNIMFSLESRTSTLLRFVAEEIYEYLLSPSSQRVSHDLELDSSKTDMITRETDIISAETVKLVTFSHCVNILCHVTSFKRGHTFFPLTTKLEENPISLSGIFSTMTSHLNCCNNSDFPIDNIITSAIIKLLKVRDCPLLDDSEFVRTVLYPIQTVVCDPSDAPNNIPWHTVRILDAICESESGVVSLLRIDEKESSSTHLSYQCSSELSPISIISSYTVYLLKDKSSNMESLILFIGMCTNIFSYVDFFTIPTEELPLIPAVICSHQTACSELTLRSSGSPKKTPQAQSEELLRALNEFLECVASWPSGLLSLSKHECLVTNMISFMLCQPINDRWKSPKFHRLIAMLAALPEGAQVLGEECKRSMSQVMNDLWNVLEDQESFVHGSDRIPNQAIMFFLDIIYSITCTLLGAESFLSEHEGSEDTLLESGSFPTTLVELLTFGNSQDPWHYTALRTLQAIVTNLDVWIYVETRFKIQEQLLQLQSDNVSVSIYDDTAVEETELLKKDIIIDESSILRNQILVATYLVRPTEHVISDINDNTFNDNLPTLLCDLSLLNTYSVNTNTIIHKVNTDFEKLLKETKLHDASWLIRARKAFHTIQHDLIQPTLIVDLVEKVANCSVTPQYSLDFFNVSLNDDALQWSDEDLLGIQIAVRYGIQQQALQACNDNEKNLAVLLHYTRLTLQCEISKSAFKGFDWLTSTVFLVCAGDVERCRRFLGHFTTLPTSLALWSNWAQAKGIQHFSLTFSSLLECVSEQELPLVSAAFKTAGVPWGLVCYGWLNQCFWNVLEWNQVCQWLALCILHPPDMTVYFCVALLMHLQAQILEAATSGSVWERIKLAPVSGFYIADQMEFMEKMIKQHRSVILPKLLGRMAVNEN